MQAQEDSQICVSFFSLCYNTDWSTGPGSYRVPSTGLACAYGKPSDMEGGQSSSHPFSFQHAQGQPISSLKSAIIAQYHCWCWMTVITLEMEEYKMAL